MTFISDFSRHTWIGPMQNKSEVITHFQWLMSRVEKETNKKILCLQYVGGKEYYLDEFTEYLRNQGIHQDFTCQHTPQQLDDSRSRMGHVAWKEHAQVLLGRGNMPKTHGTLSHPESKRRKLIVDGCFVSIDDVNGTVNWYKARLVGKGYAQMHNINYDETFTLVAKMWQYTLY